MIPISASKFSPFPIFSKGKNLNKKLCDMLDRKNCFFFDRGASTLFVLLSILKRRSKRKKIIIPSYTADTVYIPAIQAGCEVKFCDMSLDSFNMDLRHLRKIVDKDTLAVIGVHLFGIPENMDEIEKIAEKHNVFVIDDFCQALGSKYKNKYAGSFGDASVLSFGKGKNLTAFDGGALFLDDDELIDEVNDIYKDLDKPSEIKKAFKIFGLSILSRPFWYGIFYRVLSRYRQVPAPEKIEVKKITKVQKNLISNLIDKKDKNLKQRALWGIS
ncbi:MAG: DegT/DnrJ/EryC1/StrS family aminotransferase, partial [Atribacterota bacterium]